MREMLPDLARAQVAPMLAEAWAASGLLARRESRFVAAAAALLKGSLELVTDADTQLREVLGYPLRRTMEGDEKVAEVLADNFTEVRCCRACMHACITGLTLHAQSRLRFLPAMVPPSLLHVSLFSTKAA